MRRFELFGERDSWIQIVPPFTCGNGCNIKLGKDLMVRPLKYNIFGGFFIWNIQHMSNQLFFEKQQSKALYCDVIECTELDKSTYVYLIPR